MKTMLSPKIVLIALLLVAVAVGASAQDEYWGAISATATCTGGEVQLAVTFNNATATPPADWVGWVVERKVGGGERSILTAADTQFHESEYQRLTAELEQAMHASGLPDAPTAKAALNDLLLRARLGAAGRVGKRGGQWIHQQSG